MASTAAGSSQLVALDTLPDTDYLYTHHDRVGLRIISFATSTISIVSCLVAFFWLYRLKNRLFRHNLIFWLLFFDFGRAIILFWYPIRLWITGEDSIGPHACQADGFFASLCVEASDFGILVIAVHTVMFIVRPKVGDMPTYTSGGLYPYRHYVYLAWAVFALLFASLPFVNTHSPDITQNERWNLGYIQLSTWCYLPVRPIWYRLVLAWIPRYLILMTIAAIYIGVYLYVRRVMRSVDNALTQTVGAGPAEPDTQDPRNFELSVSPLDPCPLGGEVRFEDDRQTQPTTAAVSAQGDGRNGQFVTPRYLNQIEMGTPQLDRQRSVVDRQIRYLLVYPVIYVCMWTAPFVSQCLLYSSHFVDHPVVWLGYVAACMYAISGFLNTAIFALRERPWRTRDVVTSFEIEEAKAFERIHNNSRWSRFWKRRESLPDNFPCFRRISETSALSIEKMRNRVGKIFGQPAGASSPESSVESDVADTAAASMPTGDIIMNIPRRLTVPAESAEEVSTSGETRARFIRSPYDIMKVPAPVPSRQAHSRVPKTGTTEWWDRLEELQEERSLRVFRRSSLAVADENEPAARVFDLLPYKIGEEDDDV